METIGFVITTIAALLTIRQIYKEDESSKSFLLLTLFGFVIYLVFFDTGVKIIQSKKTIQTDDINSNVESPRAKSKVSEFDKCEPMKGDLRTINANQIPRNLWHYPSTSKDTPKTPLSGNQQIEIIEEPQYVVVHQAKSLKSWMFRVKLVGGNRDGQRGWVWQGIIKGCPEGLSE